MINSPLGYKHIVEISEDSHLLPVYLQRHFPQGEHSLVFYVAFFPSTGIEFDIVRYVPRQFYMYNALLSVTPMLHSSDVPSENNCSFGQQIADAVSNAALHHDFSASNALFVYLYIYSVADSVFGQALEHDTRESADAFRPFAASKSSIEALEVVKDVESNFGADRITRCRTIFLEQLSLYSDHHDDDYDDDDDDDDNDNNNNDHEKVLRMPCSHLYHKDCMVRWLENRCLCRLCRYATSTN